MDVEYLSHVIKCPKCKGNLLWDREQCAECGTPFRVEGNLLDFIDRDSIARQNKAQIDLHEVLAYEYKKRYEPEYSRVYSEYWNRQFLSHLPENPQLILDNGCGTGDLLREMLPLCKMIIGSDISKAMLKEAGNLIGKTNRILWVVSPGESLPFADGIFDVICFRGALHHMSDEVLALKEAYRLLRNGGLLMLSEPNDDSLLLKLPRKIANRRIARFGNDHKAFSSKKWLKTIEQAGFSIKTTKYFSFLSQPLCGMSDLFPLMKIFPFSGKVGGLLVRFDEICSKLPIIRRQSFDLFVVARKKTNLRGRPV